jgi:fructan beta-fructosidase
MRFLFFIGLCFLIMFSCRTNDPAEPVAERFRERYRPQIHFSPPAQWMNDPNGMVFVDGTYHLFYQHYPDSTVWGPMHWGHAVSTDLVHWEHQPIALYPDSLGMIFSGSAVYDVQNSSGLGTSDNPPLVAIFTYHLMEGEKQGRVDYQTQGIAYSTDKGKTWIKYHGNPVLKNPGIKDFRDPKVFWHTQSKKWVMILAVSDHVELYGSDNLLDWKKLSEFGKENGSHGGVWECPDLFELTVEGEKDSKWVMLLSINPGGPNGGSATQYFVGEFDGQNFTSETPGKDTLWLDYGPDNYAGVTWSNIPESDGRRIFLGWMSNWAYGNVVPTHPWRSAMTVPRELKLARGKNGYHVTSGVAQEINNLVVETKSIPPALLEGEDLYASMSERPAQSWVEGKIESKDFTIELSNSRNERVTVSYDAALNRFSLDRSKSGEIGFSPQFAQRIYAPRISSSDTISFSMVVDVSSVEVFFDEGTTNMTAIFFPSENFDMLEVKSSAPIQSYGFELRRLRSSWK